MMLGSLRYDLQVEYEPGKNLLIADTLSRAPKRKALKLQPTQRMNLKYSSLKTFQSVKKKMEQCNDATRKDLTLQKLKNTVISRWPERKSQEDPVLRECWNIKGEISVCDDLLLTQDRLVVPSSLREEMLNQIHSNPI